jgi:hypothetical protein
MYTYLGNACGKMCVLIKTTNTAHTQYLQVYGCMFLFSCAKSFGSFTPVLTDHYYTKNALSADNIIANHVNITANHVSLNMGIQRRYEVIKLPTVGSSFTKVSQVP